MKRLSSDHKASQSPSKDQSPGLKGKAPDIPAKHVGVRGDARLPPEGRVAKLQAFLLRPWVGVFKHCLTATKTTAFYRMILVQLLPAL